MLEIGTYNKLKALRTAEEGMYIGSPTNGELLLPLDQVPDDLKVGEEIEVFIYHNSEDKITATTIRPKIRVNSYACLEVISVNRIGAFFDMGLDIDLLVPTKEMNVQVEVGDKRIVHMYLDEELDKLTGSMLWREFCFVEEPEFEVNQKVNLMIGEETKLGRNVLINNAFYGLIYNNEIYEELEIGDKREGYIKTIREDGDLDVSLQKLGFDRISDSSGKILKILKASQGVL
jgi:predicted RNA-binding protein (virulence factor B family)